MKYGDIFYHKDRNKFYRIARINIRRAHMVDLETGENFNNYVVLKDANNISSDEFDKMIGHARITQFDYCGHISKMFKRE